MHNNLRSNYMQSEEDVSELSDAKLGWKQLLVDNLLNFLAMVT